MLLLCKHFADETTNVHPIHDKSVYFLKMFIEKMNFYSTVIWSTEFPVEKVVR